MQVLYGQEPALAPEEFRDILVASTLGARRPVADLARLGLMLRHANILVTARHDGKLIGVARAITDFAFCCYLSDLAVDASFQRQGIGKRLLAETRILAGPQTALILIAAPAAESYYPTLGMQPVKSAWVFPASS